MRDLRGGTPSTDQLLPKIDDVKDPVLAAIWGGGAGPKDVVPLAGSRRIASAAGGHEQIVGGERYVYLYRAVDTLGETPWYIGLYLPASNFATEIQRLVTAAAAGSIGAGAAERSASLVWRSCTGWRHSAGTGDEPSRVVGTSSSSAVGSAECQRQCSSNTTSRHGMILLVPGL